LPESSNGRIGGALSGGLPLQRIEKFPNSQRFGCTPGLGITSALLMGRVTVNDFGEMPNAIG
jgi:hypothetical protein